MMGRKISASVLNSPAFKERQRRAALAQWKDSGTQEERFWRKVEKSNECWLWTAATAGGGYGTAWWDGGKHQAHRVSWFIAHGVWPPKNLLVCHKCDVKPCVRPDHLFLGTMSDNLIDASKKGRVWRGGPNWPWNKGLKKVDGEYK